MELKELSHIINTHLKDNSLAHATFDDDIFQDSVIVEHPKHEKIGSSITITKSLGCWKIEYERFKGKGVSIEMKIETSDNREDIREIIHFVNDHTMHDTPQIAVEGEAQESN